MQGLGSLPSMWGTRMEFPAPGFSLAQSGCDGHLGGEAADKRSLSFSVAVLKKSIYVYIHIYTLIYIFKKVLTTSMSSARWRVHICFISFWYSRHMLQIFFHRRVNNTH